jgi:hypothetical protein
MPGEQLWCIVTAGKCFWGGIVTVVERGQRQLHEQRAAVISIFLSGTGDAQPLERREARCSGRGGPLIQDLILDACREVEPSKRRARTLSVRHMTLSVV